MNSFITPDITVFDIVPQIDIELNSGSKVPGVPS